MAISIISAKQFKAKLKATIQATGKLGFTSDTAKNLNLNNEKHIKFAKDDENESLYIIINDKASDDAFPVRESSGYFYAPTARMFDMLGMDYQHYTIIFDLVRQSSLDDMLQGEVYLMRKRQKTRNEKSNDNDIDLT